MLVNLPAQEPIGLISAQADLVPVALVPYQVAARFLRSSDRTANDQAQTNQRRPGKLRITLFEHLLLPGG